MSKKRTQSHERHTPGHSGGAHEKAGHGHEHGHEHEHAPGHEHDDDLIVVPKGESRTRFYFKLGLMIFLLIIFVVPGALMSSLTMGSEDRGETYLAWTGPDGTRHELDYAAFVQAKREMLWLDDTNPGFQQFRGLGNLALLGLGDFDPKEEIDTARFLILEELARHEGIRATPADLTQMILDLFGSPETYHAVMQSKSGFLSAQEFEELMGRALVVRRFLGYVAAAAATSDPEEVVSRWQAEHQEYAFDYVQVATADFAEETRAELPADEQLQAWFEGLPQNQKSKYNTPPRWSAEFAVVPLGEDVAADWSYEELLAKYPRPEDTDAEELARQYYNNFKFYRFKRAEPLSAEEEEDPQLRQFFPFEEVAEAAKREAPVYYALMDWHADLVADIAAAEEAAAAEQVEDEEGDEDAEAGDEPEAPAEEPAASAVDLAARASELGLEHVATTEARSNPEWLEAEMPWGGTESRIVARMSGVAEGRLIPSVYVDADAMAIARVVEKVPPGLPDFAEIRDQVADDWVAEHQAEKAVARLAELREKLQAAPEEPEDGAEPAAPETVSSTREELAAAAAAMGLEVQRRDFAERQDPGLAEDEAPIETLLRFNPIFYSIAEGEVPEPKTDFARENAFLVRFAGQRDPDVANMEPADLQTIRRQVESESVTGFFARTFSSSEYLAETYQMRLRDPKAEAKEREERPEPAN